MGAFIPESVGSVPLVPQGLIQHPFGDPTPPVVVTETVRQMRKKASQVSAVGAPTPKPRKTTTKTARAQKRGQQ